MKHTQTRISFPTICLLLLSGALAAPAANQTKLDTTSMAATTANWSAAPAVTDIGEFNGTPGAASLAGLTLGGANLTLAGLLFDNTMQGPATIASGNVLTLGGSGINMSAANQSVTINCSLSNSAQTVESMPPESPTTMRGSVGAV